MSQGRHCIEQGYQLHSNDFCDASLGTRAEGDGSSGMPFQRVHLIVSYSKYTPSGKDRVPHFIPNNLGLVCQGGAKTTYQNCEKCVYSLCQMRPGAPSSLDTHTKWVTGRELMSHTAFEPVWQAALTKYKTLSQFNNNRSKSVYLRSDKRSRLIGRVYATEHATNADTDLDPEQHMVVLAMVYTLPQMNPSYRHYDSYYVVSYATWLKHGFDFREMRSLQACIRIATFGYIMQRIAASKCGMRTVPTFLQHMYNSQDAVCVMPSCLPMQTEQKAMASHTNTHTANLEALINNKRALQAALVHVDDCIDSLSQNDKQTQQITAGNQDFTKRQYGEGSKSAAVQITTSDLNLKEVALSDHDASTDHPQQTGMNPPDEKIQVLMEQALAPASKSEKTEPMPKQTKHKKKRLYSKWDCMVRQARKRKREEQGKQKEQVLLPSIVTLNEIKDDAHD